MSKGSKRRPGDEDAYRSNYDRIFKNSKISRCEICHTEIQTIGSQDEFLDYCPNCERIVEGQTYESKRHD